MSKRQFTILVVLSALVLSSVLFLLFRPCYNCSKSGINEKGHGGNGTIDMSCRTSSSVQDSIHPINTDATGSIFVVVKKDMSLVNPSGIPAANVFVELVLPPIQGRTSVSTFMVTPPTGIVSFTNVSPGLYLIRASSDVFQRQYMNSVDSNMTDTCLILF